MFIALNLLVNTLLLVAIYKSNKAKVFLTWRWICVLIPPVPPPAPPASLVLQSRCSPCWLVPFPPSSCTASPMAQSKQSLFMCGVQSFPPGKPCLSKLKALYMPCFMSFPGEINESLDALMWGKPGGKWGGRRKLTLLYSEWHANIENENQGFFFFFFTFMESDINQKLWLPWQPSKLLNI